MKSGLAQYVGDLQSIGTYVFERKDALAAAGLSAVAFKHALRRLFKAGRLASPRRGFYVIVPLEYRSMGAPPADWYIDALMKFLGRPYYVGLLTAAALHGAAHQAPQEFQVLTSSPLRPADVGRSRIRFFVKGQLEQCPTLRMNTITGTMVVSTPEATALDLVRYPHGAGYLDNAATVLAELAESMDEHRLVEAAEAESELASVQRLGYLLDLVGAGCQEELADWLRAKRVRSVLLRPGRPFVGVPKDTRWSVILNETVEPEI